MVTRDSDAASVRLPPPLVYVVAVGAGLGLQRFVAPLDLPVNRDIRIGNAILAGVAGLLLVSSALRAFRRTGQDVKPWKTTSEFIGTGAFRWSRNPMYAGLALGQTALAFVLANGWLLAFVPVVLAVIQVTAIRHEEAYLEEKFGDTYRTYKASVRRWL